MTTGGCRWWSSTWTWDADTTGSSDPQGGAPDGAGASRGSAGCFSRPRTGTVPFPALPAANRLEPPELAGSRTRSRPCPREGTRACGRPCAEHRSGVRRPAHHALDSVVPPGLLGGRGHGWPGHTLLPPPSSRHGGCSPSWRPVCPLAAQAPGVVFSAEKSTVGRGVRVGRTGPRSQRSQPRCAGLACGLGRVLSPGLSTARGWRRLREARLWL